MNILRQPNAQGGQDEQLQNALRKKMYRFKEQTKALRTKLLEGTMQETQSTLEETKRETLTPDTLKMILIVITTILSFLIKP